MVNPIIETFLVRISIESDLLIAAQHDPRPISQVDPTQNSDPHTAPRKTLTHHSLCLHSRFANQLPDMLLYIVWYMLSGAALTHLSGAWVNKKRARMPMAVHVASYRSQFVTTLWM